MRAGVDAISKSRFLSLDLGFAKGTQSPSSYWQASHSSPSFPMICGRMLMADSAGGGGGVEGFREVCGKAPDGRLLRSTHPLSPKPGRGKARSSEGVTDSDGQFGVGWGGEHTRLRVFRAAPRCPAAGFTVYSALGCGVGAARRFKPSFRRGRRKRHAKARVVPFGLKRAKDLPTTFSYSRVRKNQFPLKK